MQKEDFKIGEEFYTNTSKWRCTDIGSRVIVAIELKQENLAFQNGPPYSIAELVFDEYDFAGCSLGPDDFIEESEPEENIDELLKNKKLNSLHEAFFFTSAGGCGENTAILDKNTWAIYYQSEYLDNNDEISLAEEDYDTNIHIELPHKNDLDLGSGLVFEFVEKFIPDAEDKVYQMFKKRRAYSHYKDFLDSRNLLEKWSEFEMQHELLALLEWCKENDIDVMA